uniref:J domain-containing protein n=1 Tax=Euplotes crassus TaxID=5936 RepID=A0A7S3KQF2_EUPCR|mmetsp:Transcript_39496/g.39055  ORF Transcript_39496/g.39055 Transcript_39496/m.39055 type:complete len:270 (+) Transcript_39496:9-818(+)
MGKDYYKILQISRDSNREDIANSFRELAVKYHPLRETKSLEDKSYIFSEICEAYDVLSNPETKIIYDQYGEKLLKEGIPTPKDGLKGGYAFHGDYLEVFRSFFGTSNPFIDITMPVVGGSKKKVEEEKKDCSSTVPVPIDPETLSIYYSSKDEVPKEIPLDDIRMRGYDLVQTYHISLQDALLSTPISIITLTGERIELSIDEVITPQTEKKIEGKGLPLIKEKEYMENLLGKQKKGDLYIVFDIEFPTRLTQEQKDQLKEIEEIAEGA